MLNMHFIDTRTRESGAYLVGSVISPFNNVIRICVSNLVLKRREDGILPNRLAPFIFKIICLSLRKSLFRIYVQLYCESTESQGVETC